MAIRKPRQQDHEIDPEQDDGDEDVVITDDTAGAHVAPEMVDGSEHPALAEARARAATKDHPLTLPDGEAMTEAHLIDLMNEEQRDAWLVMSPAERAEWVRGEARVWVEAVKPGTYPELDDPRYEVWATPMRFGRTLNPDTNETNPGQCFRMRRRDVESILKGPRSTRWVRILAKGEIPKPIKAERYIPGTSAPRGYGQGRKIGRIIS